MVADVRKNLFHHGTRWKINFKLRTFLISAQLRRPFVCKHVVTAYASYTDQFAVSAKSALGIVQQDVGFEHPGLPDAETQFTELLAYERQVAAQAQLDLDFDLQWDTLRHRRGECQLPNNLTTHRMLQKHDDAASTATRAIPELDRYLHHQVA